MSTTRPVPSLAAVAFAAALCGGCSLRFDPATAAPLQCPEGPQACAPRDHAQSACVEQLCHYTCESGFADIDGDLDAPQSNGCEARCDALTTPVANVSSLEALAGTAPGVLLLSWPEPSPLEGVRPAAYRVCHGPPGDPLTDCVDHPRQAVCADGACAAEVTGLPDNQRRALRVTGVDGCGRTSMEQMAPILSATPINGTFETDSGWTRELFGCTPNITASGGQLTIEQQGFCVTRLTAGDEQWGDFTLDVQIFAEQALGTGYSVGVSVRENTQGHRVTALLSPSVGNSTDTVALAQVSAGRAERKVATAVPLVPVDRWQWLRVVARGDTYSVLLGENPAAMTEVLRWRPLESPEAFRAGKPGLVMTGSGRVRIRNLRLYTAAELPPRGPTDQRFDFDTLPASMRVVPEAAHARVSTRPCPAFPEAPDCDAGACAPPEGARCLDVKSGYIVQPTAVLFPLPIGVDPLEPYQVSFRFAAEDAGVNDGLVLGSANGELGRLVDITQTWELRTLNQPTGRTITPGTWNAVALTVDPAGQRLSVQWNGADAGSFAFPIANNPTTHLGAFEVGGFATLHGYWTGLEVRQRP